MFGYIIINKGDMKFKEFDVYHSYYCGLCNALKQKYGITGQFSLSYDMTFVVMLLSSLYEPETKLGQVKCAAHPFEKHAIRQNEFSGYGADMNVLFTYYKCRDDWEDEKKVSRLAYSKLLCRAYRSVCLKYGEKAKKIAGSMWEIAQGEKNLSQDIDYMAGLFGGIMGEILAVREDEWQEGLKSMGNFLGKFIYLLDAYEDVEEDIKQERYNPLKRKFNTPDFEEEIKTILTMMMAECCREFEKLPIIENAEILRNILYSGVWYRYEMVHEKREAGKEVRRKEDDARSI
ncbi:MAG: DUF5685 family protein [Lachnospiraceae bacterium]|nr:DUF5685 family protein [Lachnospiraceae bacterium]